MLRKEDHIKIGQLKKAHGVAGAFNAFFLPNYNPEEFIDVLLVEYDNYLVPFFVEDFTMIREDSGLIKFDHIHNIEGTIQFVNCDLYAPKNHHIQVDFIPDASSLVDYTIKDGSGKILGVVVDFIDNPNNPLLEVQNAGSTFLIPVVDDFFEKIDDAKKEIIAILPEGLIDLNE